MTFSGAERQAGYRARRRDDEASRNEKLERALRNVATEREVNAGYLKKIAKLEEEVDRLKRWKEKHKDAPERPETAAEKMAAAFWQETLNERFHHGKHGIARLDVKERDRLVKLVGMLGSAHDGERANAASKATEFLKTRGMTWADVVT